MKDKTDIVERLTQRTYGHGAFGEPESYKAPKLQVEAAEEILDLRRQIERAFQMLEVYGVSRDRAKYVSNGIEVLATRFRKDT